jgi:hypothetical protein
MLSISEDPNDFLRIYIDVNNILFAMRNLINTKYSTKSTPIILSTTVNHLEQPKYFQIAKREVYL